ncbi:pre-peptidase C-terminal domain-containing protein [Pseudolysobacter antarcticus]|uniref:pre-peptidase C-terminal domain-containing protein n=1 Tax=Pseudolysobacter antarcticus TaxID=2511995 RepID=UPI0013EB7B7D|nr:pre-peptidase C-terminal domain-containing protein [Pseudolysobacter antarcticus]
MSLSTFVTLRRKATVLTQSVLVSTVIAALASTSVSASETGFASIANNNVTTVAGATALRNGDVINGLLPFTTPMHIQVSLKMRNREVLESFVESAMHPNMLLTQPQVMSSDEFVASHAPTADQVQRVVSFLESAGFKNIEVAANHMMISADGSADIAQTAFQTSFARIQTSDGRDAFANTDAVHIPAALQDTVLAVLGLQTVHVAHTMLVKSAQINAISGHDPTDWPYIYGASGLPVASSIPVGIISQGKITQSLTDLNTFTSQHSMATVATQVVTVGSTSTDTAGVGEWDLDSQDIVGMAGGAVQKIIFYNVPTLTNASLSAGYNKAVADNQVKVINVSIGICETAAQGDGSAAANDQTFQQAIAQGQTFSISSGDSGADECNGGGQGVVPSWPASSRYVVAVGGTTLNAGTGAGAAWSSEVVWNNGVTRATGGATGGSPSTFETKPSWQTAAIVPGNFRGVPDIAFEADPNSGAKIIVNGANATYGGTSLSSPIFVGAWMRLLAAKGNLGFAAPLLYQLPAADFHDVTSGNNNGETAKADWDFTTGFGSIILSKAVNDIGGTVTPDFTLSDAPGSASVTQGASATSTISVTDSGGFTGSVALTASGLPSGVTASFSPASTTSTSTLTLTASATATTGPATVTITGTSGSLSHTTSLALTVNGSPTPNFTLSDAPGSASVTQGANATSTISVTDSGGFTGSVALTASGLPSGVTASFSPVSTTSTSTLTLTASATATTGSATITITGTSGSLSHTTSLALTVNAAGGGGGNVLTNGVAVTGLSGATGVLSADYTFTVPAGATAATVAISGGTGDADMYVQNGAAPTLSSYSCRPYVSGNGESCALTAGNTYHIKINGYAAYTGVSLIGKYTAGGGGGGGNVLTNGVAVTGLSGATGVLTADYTFTVPAGATAATVKISGGTGDADMYVQNGAAPTLSSYSCRPYVIGNNESCALTAGNTYHIKINAYSTYTGVSLLGSYTP